MAVTKSIQFLPDVFQTDTNRKFLNATVDQLISEPKLKKVKGYIGRKLSPNYKSTDSYIEETSANRQNYQLEPSIIVKNAITNNIDFATTYNDIINKIRYYGGLTNNHSRLFDNEYYTYNPKIDLDKFVNFSQYYWLENGPDAVTISATSVPLTKTFAVTYDRTRQAYIFSGYGETPNPTITLARGGRYYFQLDEPNNNFYIQTRPGKSGFDPGLTNLSTRNILGVNNNGSDVGTVEFFVPNATAQEQFTSMPIMDKVDFATSLSYKDVHGSTVDEINSLGGLDGFSVALDSKTVIFVNNELIDDVYWTDLPVTLTGSNVVVPMSQRNDVFRIQFIDDKVTLIPVVTVNNEQRIIVKSGEKNAGREYYSRGDLLNEVPLISAPLSTLFYQNSNNDNAVGGIQLIDPDQATIDPDLEIIGKINYTSPNGVAFTNGLKVTFDDSATDAYKNKTYYVEGVGSAIVLILEDNLICPELDNDLATPDYITINRSALDLNAWSRSNRWTHSDVITVTAQYNETDLIFDQDLRAKRPIIEFESNYQLYKFGAEAKEPIHIFDTLITSAFTTVQGVVAASTTSHTFTVGSDTVTLTSGDRVIFSADENNNVRNKIYNFSIVKTSESPDVYRCYIEESTDSIVERGHTVIVLSGDNGSKQWHFNGETWDESQLKTAVNQAPLFDVIDANGVSFSDTSVYDGSSFGGTKIFSYKEGSGKVDPIIGIPLSYKNFISQGDIQFENNFDFDEFSYIVAGGSEIVPIKTGFLQKNESRTICRRQNIWTINRQFSKQYQVYNYVYDGVTNLFPINNIPEESIEIPNIKVIVNNNYINSDNFIVSQVVDRFAVLVNPEILAANDIVFISIYSNSVSPSAYYEIPLNFDINSLNTNLQTLTLGQVRNHLITIKNNSINVTGDVPGASNLRDVITINNGGSILQHSAPVVYGGLFLNHPIMDFVNSIRLSKKEYTKFKNKFLDLAVNLEIDTRNIADSVDTILSKINEVKNDTFPWFYSDMVPYGRTFRNDIPTYTIFNVDLKSYEISNIFNDTITSNKAVLVYLTRTIDEVTTKTLLVKGRDFYFNQDRPAITFQDTFDLLYGDKIDIVEYDNTDGCYIPETPTKLGLYPKFIPEIYEDNTYQTPINVIQGHDGSIIPAFNDYRDNLILELERRIYNNLKITYDTNNFNLYDYVPGKFRSADYSLSEYTEILSKEFLSWVGTNRIDYASNTYFEASDPFTWNYRKFRDVVNGESLPGTWRSIYRYFYDTDRPHTHPWEMLGFSEKPDYWDNRYGPAPYTGGNDVLWSDLSLGYIAEGSRAGFDIRYQRPNLSQFIPVDDSGNLRSPEQILVADFDSLKANLSYAVGDIGPAELAWRRSSEFPYALNLTLALMKPAKYFALLCDVSTYVRNTVTSQFNITTTNQHLTPDAIPIHSYNNNGTITRATGYINWIRDYLKNLGIGDPATVIKDTLNNLNVQLSYKIAGYTDKKFIELLAEQNSPSSINDSIVIPDENYRIELYKGSPVNKIFYSAVIVEKTPNGYSVSGYNLNNPYFYIIPSQVNNNSYFITVGQQKGVIYNDFQKVKYTIPYGFEFNSKQQVVDFLVGYQRYLQSQGFVFVDRLNEIKEEQNFVLSAKEFLYWSEQGWKDGSIIVLSPVFNRLKVYDTESVVDEIKNSPFSSRILDVNLKNISSNDFSVNRENNLFSLTVNNDQTIAFAELDLVQYEHLLILDNLTVFQDVIYVPELGNRQYRLRLVGSKTDNWNGSLELPGFVYSTGNVDTWSGGVDYQKGSIVTYKSNYYTALQNIPAADSFQTLYWQKIDKTELKSGIINNFATNASDSLSFYDVDNQPNNEFLQLLSNGLIGFRSRDYFTNLGIDVVTQSKFYQGFIKQKGTTNAINALKGAVFSDLDTGIDVYENWAVRVGEYGATDVNKFIELILDESKFTNNPAPFQLIDDTVVEAPDITKFELTDIYKKSDNFVAKFLKQETNSEPRTLKPLPTAGFVHINDVDSTIFDITNYQELTNIINDIGTGYKIWTARNFIGEWDVYRANNLNAPMAFLSYNIDNIAEVITTRSHGLIKDDIVAIKNFDERYNGVYKVYEVVDDTRFYIEVYQNLTALIQEQTIAGIGILFKLTSTKVQYPYQVDSVRPAIGWQEGDKVWVSDLDGEQNWAVYDKLDPWLFKEDVLLTSSQYAGNDNFGKAIALDETSKLAYISAPYSSNGRVSAFERSSTNTWTPKGFLWGNSSNLSGFGSTLATGSGFLAVGAPESNGNRGYVYIFKELILIQILASPTPTVDEQFGAALAMSSDGKYLYIGAPGTDTVYTYSLDDPRTVTVQVYPDSSTGANPPDGTRTSFVLTGTTLSNPLATDVVITAPQRSAEYIPYVDYTITSFTNGINGITSTGTAVDPAPSATITHYSVSGTGGTGTGALFNVKRTIGSTSYTVTCVHPGSGYTVGDTLTISGASIGGTSPTNDITVTVASRYSKPLLTFTTAPSAFEKISVVEQEYYYSSLGTIAPASSGDQFGSSIAINSNGTTIAIGAKNATNNGISGSGQVYVYGRTVSEFITDGVISSYSATSDFGPIYRVYLDNRELTNGVDYYVIGTRTVQFNPFNIPAGNKTLRIETNNFLQDQLLVSGSATSQEENFGAVIGMCSTGCNIFVSSPEYKESHYTFGKVTRFVNLGRVYGTITGTEQNPVTTAGHDLIINNVTVQLTGTTVAQAAQDINASGIIGVTALVVDGKLKIDSDVVLVGEKLTIKAGVVGTAIEDLGLLPYKESQILKHPEEIGEKFGTAIAVNQTTSLVAIGSEGADMTVPMAIDLKATEFDSGSTTFVDYSKDSGAVYLFDLMQNPYESADYPSVFSYTQKLTAPEIQDNSQFGSSIAIYNDLMLVGVADDSWVVPDGGRVVSYYNEDAKSGWNLIRFKQPRVDIDSITGVFIYNKKTQNIIEFFDILDPAKGKLLGTVDQELDFKEDYDPASYNNFTTNAVIQNTNFYWTSKQVGKCWWDTSLASFIDYEQDTLQYKTKNWASLFPGSQIKIYEWVESEFLPSQYVANGGNGVPKYADDSAYSSETIVDPVTGIIKQKYYFWVGDKTSVDVNKSKRTLSIKSLESLISNPKDQNIPFIAPIDLNAMALYNIGDRLSGTDIVLHIEVSEQRNSNLLHNEYQLIQEGNPTQIIPFRVINKLRDSLVGFNQSGQLIPDPTISLENRTGILLRPRQSFFVNRLPALKTFVTSLNAVFQTEPILLITNASKLYAEEAPPLQVDAETGSSTELSYLSTSEFPNGYSVLIRNDADYNGKWTYYTFNATTQAFELTKIQSYKTTLFWDAIDWYDQTYSQGSPITYTINRYADIQTISPVAGNTIKILDNGNGQWLIYQVNSDLTLNLVGAQNATLQLKEELYDSTLEAGFDSKVFDLIEFDPQAGIEMSKIFDSVYEEIYIKDLAIEFNKLFFQVINYIFSEQKNPDWIFKTSFIDVNHRLRTLKQISSYTRDNQNFYEDYINEAKPYRTKLREYIPQYSSLDTATGNWTDFDLPSTYDTTTSTFRSPDSRVDSDIQALQTEDIYKNWYDNYKYSIVDFRIADAGEEYTIAPQVEITGGSGADATAIATVNPATGKVTGIYVTNPGSGYTTTPTVTINGLGAGARAYPVLRNEYISSNVSNSYNKIRSIETTIKFDRTDYQSNIIVWQPNTAYANTVVYSDPLDTGNIYITSGNIVVYNKEAFLAINANVSTSTIFDYTRFNRLDSGNILLKAVDRIEAYYTTSAGRPAKDIRQLIDGIEYPGTKVIGESFIANAFHLYSNIVSFDHTRYRITSSDISQLDFIKEGFDLNHPIKIEAMVPFEFSNNGTFKVVSIDRDEMVLTGGQIDSIYNLTVGENITANVGDYITQANSSANAYVVGNVVNARTIPIIHKTLGYTLTANVIYINGLITGANVQEIVPGGTVSNIKISDLYLDDVIDSNIYSTYTDTALGTRPEDINIVGGAYVDTYSSHAPEELIPGRVYDTLEMRVFTNNAANTATYGFRVFESMNGNIEFKRISNTATSSLAANLSTANTHIFVANVEVFPDPGPVTATPGIVFINGEKIHYYKKYTSADIAAATPWAANTVFAVGTIVSNINSNTYLVTGNVYANANAYINTANIQQVYPNTLTQLLRGVDGTGIANLYTIGTKVVDSSLIQLIPNTRPNVTTLTGELKSTANVTWKITLSGNISANLGDYITQFVGNTTNVRVLSSVTNSNVVAVDFISGNLIFAANAGTRVNIANVTTFTTTTANVIAMQPLGKVQSNGNVILSSARIFQSNLWVQLGTGTGLEGSSLDSAQFIRAEPSYIP